MYQVYLASAATLTVLHMAGLLTRDVDVASSFNNSIESLTRDVYVKPLHSHNDYWRHDPLIDAVKVGAQLIEADVFVFTEGYTLTQTLPGGKTQDTKFGTDDIYVGHNQVFLKPENTLNALYLDNLYNWLQFSNPKFSPNITLVEAHDTKYSIWWNQPEEPVYLWLDFKTQGNDTYPSVKKYFQRFIDEDYLAYYDTEQQKHVPGPVIVTITGNLPTELVKADSKRYFYLDAPLANLTLDDWGNLSRVALGLLELVLDQQSYKSAQILDFSDDDKKQLKDAFDNAHSKGLKTRVWGDITWPNLVLDSHLRDIFLLGGDFLNVDNLTHAATLL